MNKIILNMGLLFFFLSVIYFGQRELPLQDVLLRAFAIFMFLTTMLSIIALIFIKSINKRAYHKRNNLEEN